MAMLMSVYRTSLRIRIQIKLIMFIALHKQTRPTNITSELIAASDRSLFISNGTNTQTQTNNTNTQTAES
jgi:hypothetical protein